MKSFFEEYSRVIGLLLLVFVIIIVFSTPSMILARTITTIDTELSYASDDATPVRTKMDFGNKEHLQKFPEQLGNWTASEYNTTGLAERLNADVMLMRAYSHPKYYQPVFFLIMQSNNRSSFHPPTVCYPALGYTIEEEGMVVIPVQNMSWVEGSWFGTVQDLYPNVTVTAKKLIVTKESKEEGKVTERRVVLYFYVKETFASNTVTMVRISALASRNGSYSGILNRTKEFMGDTVPYLFEVQKEYPILLTVFSSGPTTGKVAIVMLFLVPLAFIFYPSISGRLKKR
jgi:hypothetical protein